MRIDELKKEIKILSDEKGIMLRVIERDGYVCIQRQEALWREVALVKLSENFAINTNNIWFEMLEEEIKGKIFDILVEFARTPADEREEEKKYQYRLKEKYWWIVDKFYEEKTYLNFRTVRYNLADISLDNKEETSSHKTKFTDEEIEELAEKYDIDLNIFDKIEVE